jgi:hypothetical protein
MIEDEFRFVIWLRIQGLDLRNLGRRTAYLSNLAVIMTYVIFLNTIEWIARKLR